MLEFCASTLGAGLFQFRRTIPLRVQLLCFRSVASAVGFCSAGSFSRLMLAEGFSGFPEIVSRQCFILPIGSAAESFHWPTNVAIGSLLISYGFPLTQVVMTSPLSKRSPSATTKIGDFADLDRS